MEELEAGVPRLHFTGGIQMTQQDKWYFQNILFGILGGWIFAAIWFLMGALFYITFIGRPIAKCCFLIARFAARPYGRVVGVTGDYSYFGNIFWLLFIGVPWVFFFTFIGSLFTVTIVGVPIGHTYLRLAGLVAAPVGMQLERQLEDWQWKRWF